MGRTGGKYYDVHHYMGRTGVNSKLLRRTSLLGSHWRKLLFSLSTVYSTTVHSIHYEIFITINYLVLTVLQLQKIKVDGLAIVSQLSLIHLFYILDAYTN